MSELQLLLDGQCDPHGILICKISTGWAVSRHSPCANWYVLTQGFVSSHSLTLYKFRCIICCQVLFRDEPPLQSVSYLASFLPLWTVLGISLCWSSSRCESAYRLPCGENIPLNKIEKADFKFETNVFSSHNKSSVGRNKRQHPIMPMMTVVLITFLVDIAIQQYILFTFGVDSTFQTSAPAKSSPELKMNDTSKSSKC